MTPQEFAAKVKAKYPQYANLSDAQLTARMVAKYPQYKSQINFSPTLQAKNALGGALSDIKSAASSAASQAAEGFNISNTATNPFDLIRGAAKMGAGAANIVFSPLAPVMAPVGAAVNAVADKVSDIPAVQNFALSRGGKALSTGVDFAADLNTVAGAVAAVKTPAAPRTTAPAKGAPTPFNLLRTEAKTPTASIPKAAPTFSESTMQRVARISPAKQVAFKERSGVSVGKYLTDRGIYGDAPQVAETLASRWLKSKEIVDQELGNLPGTYKNAALGSMVKELLQREQAVSSVGAPSPELGIVSQLYKKLKGEGLTMNEVNTVKRLYESRVKLGYLKENNSNAIAKATNLDTKIRTWQADTASQLGFKNIGELNKETSLAYQLANDIGEAHMGRMANNAVSLTDWIVLAGGDPKAVSAFMAKKLMSNGKVQASVAKAFGPKVSVPEPSAQIAAPTIENYKNFTTRTTRTPLPQPQTELPQSLPTSIAQNEPNAGLGGLLNSAKSTVSNLVDNAKNNGQRGFVRIGGDSSPTTASKPSKAANTSTGNVPIDKTAGSKPSAAMSGGTKGGKLPAVNVKDTLKDPALAEQITNAITSSGSWTGKSATGEDVFGGPVTKGKRIDIVIGPPAAGKSELFANPLSKKNGAILIDADRVKAMMPGFNGKNAAEYHGASSDLVEGPLMRKALSDGSNIVLPIVGKTPATIETLAKLAKSYGYDVNLTLNNVPPEVAAARAATRAANTGRVVPENYILNEVGNKPSLNFDRLKKRTDLFDSYQGFDSNVEKGAGIDLTSASTRTYSFVSPNTKVGLSYADAQEALHTPEHTAALKNALAVDRSVDIPAATHSAIGKWTDGAEDTFYYKDGDIPTTDLIYATAKKAIGTGAPETAQKQFIYFKEGEGIDRVHEVHFTKVTPKEISDAASKLGIDYQTIADDRLIVFNKSGDYFDPTMMTKIFKLKQQFPDNITSIETVRGTGDFVGSWKSGDMEARQEAVDIYNGIIQSYEKNR